MSNLDWARDGADWPNGAHSQFVSAGGLRWHVQVLGQGPVLLLVHGTGASTHSFRTLAPLLAAQFTVVAPDLPGHGFTGTPDAAGFALPAVAAGLGALLTALDAAPVAAAGHSAGAAVVARMALDGHMAPRGLIALNGAMLPLPGAAFGFFAPLAKMLAGLPFVPKLFAMQARNPGFVDQMLRQTGSAVDPAGIRLYQRLARSPAQVAGALGLMSAWDLAPLAADLPRLRTPLTLVIGLRDGTIPPSEQRRVLTIAPHATAVELPRLGHLAHEEDPARVSGIIAHAAMAPAATPAEAAAG